MSIGNVRIVLMKFNKNTSMVGKKLAVNAVGNRNDVSRLQSIPYYKKHLKKVGPIRHCEPPHAHSPGVATGARQL